MSSSFNLKHTLSPLNWIYSIPRMIWTFGSDLSWVSSSSEITSSFGMIYVGIGNWTEESRNYIPVHNIYQERRNWTHPGIFQCRKVRQRDQPCLHSLCRHDRALDANFPLRLHTTKSTSHAFKWKHTFTIFKMIVMLGNKQPKRKRV